MIPLLVYHNHKERRLMTTRNILRLPVTSFKELEVCTPTRDRFSGVREDTLIRTRRGVIPIWDIRKTDRVINKEGRFVKIKEIIRRDSPVVKKSMALGNIYITPEASVFGFTGMYYRVLGAPAQSTAFVGPYWIKASERLFFSLRPFATQWIDSWSNKAHYALPLSKQQLYMAGLQMQKPSARVIAVKASKAHFVNKTLSYLGIGHASETRDADKTQPAGKRALTVRIHVGENDMNDFMLSPDTITEPLTRNQRLAFVAGVRASSARYKGSGLYHFRTASLAYAFSIHMEALGRLATINKVADKIYGEDRWIVDTRREGYKVFFVDEGVMSRITGYKGITKQTVPCIGLVLDNPEGAPWTGYDANGVIVASCTEKRNY